MKDFFFIRGQLSHKFWPPKYLNNASKSQNVINSKRSIAHETLPIAT